MGLNVALPQMQPMFNTTTANKGQLETVSNKDDRRQTKLIISAVYGQRKTEI